MNQILSGLANTQLNLADWWDRWRPREWKPRLRYFLWDRKMGQRKSEEEMWQWSDISIKGKWGKQIRVFTRPKGWPQMLVMLEMAESNSDANRLIKAGAVEMRDWAIGDEWEVINLKTPLPESPTHLRRGKKLYGIKTVWLPPPGVSQWQGEEMLREDV